MKAVRRISFQVLFWALVWVIMALGHKEPLEFMNQNWVICGIQIVIIVCITLVFAPKILAKKRSILFVVLGFVFLSICVVFAYQFSNTNLGGLPQEGLRQERLGPPDRAFPPGGPEQILNREGRDNLPELRDRPPSPRGKLTPFGKVLNSPFLINFLLLCLTVIIAAVIEIFLFARKKEEALILSKNQTLETELKLLKSQINPHFLFNALNNIYALSAIDTSKTQESIDYLSKMLRYVLYECERPFVVVQKEVDYINNYIKLFSLKSSKTYPIEIVVSLENNALEIAPMLLIPFVENAFKHSDIERVQDAFIKIHIKATRDEIDVFIQNTVGATGLVKDEVGGIGLENVKKRLSIIYPDSHTLKIYERENLFSVALNLKVNG